MAIEFLPQIGAFFLVFAIVLGLLTTAKIFNKNVNTAIAVVFGLFSAMYEPFVVGVQIYLPVAAAALVIIFFLVLLKRLAGGGGEKRDVFPLAVVIAVLLIVLGTQTEKVLMFLPAGFNPTDFLWAIGVILVLLIFWAAYMHHKSSQ